MKDTGLTDSSMFSANGVQCQWSETPECLLDFWEISASCEDHPTEIELNSGGAIVSPCTVSYDSAQPIAKIEIYHFEYSCGEADEEEAVSYDQAILLRSENGSSLCFACRLNGPGIATEIHVSDDEGTIADYLKHSQLRLTL